MDKHRHKDRSPECARRRAQTHLLFHNVAAAEDDRMPIARSSGFTHSPATKIAPFGRAANAVGEGANRYSRGRLWSPLFRAHLCSFVGFFLLSISLQAQLAVQGETVYTMAGEPIRNGVVLVKSNKVEAVGPANSVAIPDGYRVLTARVVTPGLIDARTVVGLSGILNQPQDQEQLEKSAALQPELRAIDGYNARDPLVDWVRGFGVTTLHTGHAPGALISGQTMIVKTAPANLDQAMMVPAAMTAATLGPGASSDKKDKPPGTNAKAVAMLRAELIKAAEYAQKQSKTDPDKRPARDLHLEVLTRVLDGTQPLLITVHRHQDILAALRIAAEFKLRVVLDGVSDAPLVLDEIKRSGFPVILHPTMARANEETENLSVETAAKLKKAGIPFALQSGYETYVPKTRVVLFEAGIAAANGLSQAEALAAITIDAARLLGIDKRVGSLEPGKDADLALYDGDPFEYTTHCTGVVVSGVVTDTQTR
jgi:imidazolonepropionase-like amidohydrolase